MAKHKFEKKTEEKSVAKPKIHRKKRNNVTHPAIKRLSYVGRVSRIKNDVYPFVEAFIDKQTEQTLKIGTIILRQTKKRTINKENIEAAIEIQQLLSVQ